MYLGSDEFNNAIENTSGNAPKIRVTLEDGTTLANIKSIKYYGGSNDSDDVSIGTTNMARIDVTAFTDKMLTNNEIFLEQGIELANGVVEYMPIGYFTVQKPSGDIDEVTFTAYDRMQKFEKPYSSNLAYPTTSALILDELCQFCGIELATPIESPIEVTENLKGYTCREVLGYIASMHGYFACIDRYGRLNVRWYNDTPIDKNLKKIWHFEKSQDNFEIAKVEIAKDSETNYVSGDGITTLHNSNPLATQEITDDVFAKLGGFSYSVGEIEMLDDARLDPWDMVSVEYYDGKTYSIPCMTLEHDFKAYSTTVKSVGKSESENEYRFTGPTIQYLNRMAADLLVANRVIVTKVDAEYVNSHAITTENFDAKVAEITELIVEEIDGKYANIDLANIDIANINVGKIGELFAKVGLIDRATIVEGHITGFLDAVEVNANKITAGTLIADRILLSGGDKGVLYALNNLGELTSANVDTLDGYVLTDRTINADKLIANSITANELDVNEIFGNTAVLNKLVSQEIFTNAIETNRLVVGASDKAEEALDASQSTNKASGSPILLTDSADGVLIDFKGYGRSTQDGTPTPDSPIEIKSVADSGYFDGKLLQGYYDTTNGNFTTSSVYVCSKNIIPCKPSDVVVLKYEETAVLLLLSYYDKNGNYLSRKSVTNVTSLSDTVPANAYYFHISINASAITPANAKHITVTINGKYALIVKSKWKNLWEYGDISGTTSQIITLGKALPQGTYTISSLVTSNDTDSDKSRIVLYSEDLQQSLNVDITRNTRTSATFTTTFDIKTIRFWGGMGTSTSSGDTFAYSNIQLEFGDKMTDYEPYKETVSYIPLNEPLRGINDITDEIDLESGVKISKIKETTVVITKIITMNNGNVAGLIENVSDKYNGRAGAYCSKCVYDSNISPSFSSNTFYENPVNFVIVGTPDDTLESLKEKYDGASLYYVLAEPITEDIEPVDITTYNNVTYITASDNAEMEVEYYRNTATGQQLANMHKVNKASGITVKSITIHYLATNVGSGITTSTSGWTTTVQNITADNKYLWTYQTFTYTDDTTSDTTPVISGVYGNEGTNGIGISKITPLYYLKSNTTVPSAPTSAVTSTATTSDVWTTAVPTYVSGYTYFTCTQTLYSNNTYGWSTIVIDNGLTNANSTANTANNTANGIKNNIYKSGTTLIDGAKIYTGSITADKIDVDDLFAEDITATGTIKGAILKSINYDEDTGVGMLLNLNNATIESRGEDFVNIFDSKGHYGMYTLAPEGMIFAEERDYLTGQPNLSITNGQLTLNNVKYNSYGIRYSDVDILNWTTEGIATPKLSTDLIYCNGEMAAKTVTASVIRNSTYDLGNVGNIAVQNKQNIATMRKNLNIFPDYANAVQLLDHNTIPNETSYSYTIPETAYYYLFVNSQNTNTYAYVRIDCGNMTLAEHTPSDYHRYTFTPPMLFKKGTVIKIMMVGGVRLLWKIPLCTEIWERE